MNVISAAISRARATLCIMILIVVAGIQARNSMTIEASPNPSVPIAVVSVYQDGISPEDGARLLVRPLEKELRSLEGLKEIRATSRESISYVIVEFEADQDVDQALLDVRTAVDRAKAELPLDAEEPVVNEVSADDAPTIIVTVAGEVQERVLYQTAQTLKRQIESLPSVLEAELTGHREEVIEATIDPSRVESYGITSGEIFNAVVSNNLLVPAGNIDTGEGRFAVKVPALIEDRDDVYNLPIRANADGVIRLGEVADVRRTFKDPWQYTTVNGERAISIEVRKRNEANDIAVTKAVRELVDELKPSVPEAVTIDYLMDQSDFSIGMINEMQGNIMTAMVLVMVIIVAALGYRSGILVGAGIPFSLLFGLLVVYFIGFSFNFMVLFGMLLALGMLIDGAIVVTEYADRKMAEGSNSKEAYRYAVKRMLWPVTASTTTTLAAFLPIMFWPGVAGEFMRYLPVTVFAVLVGSLLYALLFAPVMGALMGKNKMDEKTTDFLKRLETDDPRSHGGITGKYVKVLTSVIDHPFALFVGAIYLLVAIFMAFANFNKGVEFFVETEQIIGTVDVRAQGNLAVEEARELAAEVEKVVMSVPGVKVVYSVASPGAPQQFGPRSPEKDQIAAMLIETYKPEVLGRSTKEVYAEIRQKTKGMPGVYVNAVAMEGGPPVGKPVQIQLESLNREKLLNNARDLRAQLEKNIPGLRDVTDSTPLPGIEWTIEVDRDLAAQMGANVMEVGRAVQLVTNGIKLSEYRPDDADDEVDIRVRLPESERGLQQLKNIKVNTANGTVAASSFVKRIASPRVDKVQRINGKEYAMVLADVEDGVNAEEKVKEIKAWLKDHPLDKEVRVVYRGANEEQEKSQAFLTTAMLLALFLMFILLVTQFNSFYQAFLTLSSVILSTAGVFLGLTLTGSTFSVIMTGVGIVALAGIVVNNNIVLIDTFNHVRKTRPELEEKEAALLAATLRLRPVFLTTFTTILGLLPLARGLSIDLVGRTIIHGGVVGSFWVSLASAIVYGLLFSTILTLVVTPAMLALPHEAKALYRKYVKTPYRHFRENPGRALAPFTRDRGELK